MLHGEYVRRGELMGTGQATTVPDAGAGGFVVVDKGMDIASVTSGVYNVATPHNGGHHPPPRPGSAASSHLSGMLTILYI